MNRILLISISAMTLVTASRGQGFVNLDFESAKVIFTTNFIGAIATTDALPGWSAFSGTNQLSLVELGPSSISVPLAVDLVGSSPAVIADVIDGNFSVLLYDGAISQTGLVPSGTASLLFDAFSPYGGSPSLSVSLGGQNLSYEAIGSGTNPYGNPYTIYGANISPLFAGQMETLTFSGGGEILDDIQFSPEIIPEPSTASLVLLGSGILVYVRKRRRLCGAA